MVKNLWIVKKILETEIPSQDFSFLQLLKISRKKEIVNYYIGDKYRIYSAISFAQYEDHKRDINSMDEKYRATLFRHYGNDHIYYDVLDFDTQYTLVTDPMSKQRNVCMNLKSLEEKVKKVKRKEQM